jgi:hypothetical protein
MPQTQNGNYAKKHFSLTCTTSDSAVLHCLRGLSQWAEKLAPRNITWGGTGEKDWQDSHGKFTLFFSDPEYRENFIRRGKQLLPNLWEVVSQRDDLAATRQRPSH